MVDSLTDGEIGLIMSTYIEMRRHYLPGFQKNEEENCERL